MATPAHSKPFLPRITCTQALVAKLYRMMRMTFWLILVTWLLMLFLFCFVLQGSVPSGLDNPIYGYYTPSDDSQIPVKIHKDFGRSFSGIAIARNPKRLRGEAADQDSSAPYQEYQSLLQPDGEK